MCSITGSFSTEKLRELVELNLYRGNYSHSISYYNPRNKHIVVTRKLEPINLNEIDIPVGMYGICHTQAPTTEARGIESVHPADANSQLLWHNGIIKEHVVKHLQGEWNTNIEWDTKLLLLSLIKNKTPRGIDGTFTCLWYNNDTDLIAFRNEISPLFVDSDLNLSSTKFVNSTSIPANKLLKLDLDTRTLVEVGQFSTVETPYFFWD